MKLNVSLMVRLRQLFCKHDRGVGWGCCSEGINRKKGYWHVTYECGHCGFTKGEWIEGDRNKLEEMFEQEIFEVR
jgi:RNase P subunit RPR2